MKKITVDCKTIFFKGLSEYSFVTALLLTDPNLDIDTMYHFGALKISYYSKDSAQLGLIIAKAHKGSNFKRVQRNPYNYQLKN